MPPTDVEAFHPMRHSSMRRITKDAVRPRPVKPAGAGAKRLAAAAA
jgi:hypothetical protein